MKAPRLSATAAGLLALACAASVVLATALDAEARLGPASADAGRAVPAAPASPAR